MTSDSIALAADLLASMGEKASIRRVCALLKTANGKAARWSQVRSVIRAWEAGEFHRASPGQQSGSASKHNGQHAVPARDNCLFELGESSVLRTSSSPPVTSNGRRRELKLPFDRETLDARNAILAAVWKHLKPIIGRSTTFTDWRKRNAVVARSFADGGFRPEHIVAAWEDASKRRGETIRELSLVQKFLESVEVQLAGRSP